MTSTSARAPGSTPSSRCAWSRPCLGKAASGSKSRARRRSSSSFARPAGRTGSGPSKGIPLPRTIERTEEKRFGAARFERSAYLRFGLSSGKSAISLDFPMGIALLEAHPSVRADVGRIAVSAAPSSIAPKRPTTPAWTSKPPSSTPRRSATHGTRTPSKAAAGRSPAVPPKAVRSGLSPMPSGEIAASVPCGSGCDARSSLPRSRRPRHSTAALHSAE